jgi:hypothetical protein
VRTTLPDTAVSTVEEVRITVAADAWPKRSLVWQYVTPLRLRISNRGDSPLKLDYRKFELVAGDGERYAAIPPHQLQGGATAPMLAPGHTPLDYPAFHHQGFVVAPYYSAVYPFMPVYAGRFDYDPYYFDRYYGYWARTPLPTAEVRMWALPAGVVEPGGEVIGFVFFERLDADHAKATFRFDLVDPRNGRQFGEIRIPFLVGVGPDADEEKASD